ncbi:MAG: acyltransferase family protein [Acetatifactor sp.]|nr:acyltransferase family protein [Acetatifactor sp.]
MQKSRVQYVDIYKGIGIILVVLGHMEATSDHLKVWLNAFHMPLFFAAAGLLISEGRLYERKSASVVRGRAQSILIPYFWFSLIAILWDGVKALLTKTPFSQTDVAAKLWDSFSFFGVSVLWFLPVFFVGVTGYQLLRKRIVYPAALLLLTMLAAAICILNGFPGELAAKEMSVKVFLLKLSCVFLRGFVGMFFCALGEGMSILTGYLTERKAVMLPAGLIMTGIGTYLAIMNALISGYPVSFCYLLVGNIALFFGAAICLSGGILLLCCWIGKLAPLEYLGRYSMIIMVTHLDLRVLNLAQRAGNKAWELTGQLFVHGIVVLVTIIVLELFCIWLFDNCLGFMLGKKHQKPSL